MSRRPSGPARRAVERWERATGDLLEAGLRSPFVLDPAGSAIAAVTRAKHLGDRLLGRWWGLLGLPTRRDQERALHALNELESRLLDLEERLREREAPPR